MARKGKGKGKAQSGVKRRRTRNTTTFNIYVNRVLKQVHPYSGISKQAMVIVDDVLHHALQKLAVDAASISRQNKRKTITERDMRAATSLLLTGDLTRHANAEGRKAVAKFSASSSKQKPQKRAGLIFSIARVARLIRHYVGQKIRLAANASIYATAVIEYLAAEVLELSGNAARDNKRKRVIPRHILLALSADDELNALIGGAHIARGGVHPYVHKALVPAKRPKKQKNKLHCTQIYLFLFFF